MSERPRLLSAILLVVYLLFLASVLVRPDPGAAISVVGGVAVLLEGWGVPTVIAEASRVEVLLNALMFAPVPLLASLAFPRHPWANWVVYGFVGSVLVELLQGALLPLRSAQYVDIVANTSGSVVGAIGALIIRHWRRRPLKGVNCDTGR